MKNQQLLTAKQRPDTKRKDAQKWRQARSIITDVAVQVGALIDGVCTDSGDPIHSWAIRFSWPESAGAGHHAGLMRIAMSPAEGLVRINASPLDSPDKGLVFDRSVAMWELTSQKLGQVLMDAHAWTIRNLTPGLCQMGTSDSPPGTEDVLLRGIKSLAVTQPAALSVQI